MNLINICMKSTALVWILAGLKVVTEPVPAHPAKSILTVRGWLLVMSLSWYCDMSTVHSPVSTVSTLICQTLPTKVITSGERRSILDLYCKFYNGNFEVMVRPSSVVIIIILKLVQVCQWDWGGLGTAAW